MAKRRVFITGATGFAGRHLMALLHPLENVVYGTSFPQPPRPDERNVFPLDLRSERDVFEGVKRAAPQWVFHLAAVSNVGYSWANKKETLETNVTGTFHLLEALKKFVPEARVLFVSSSDIYGFSPGAATAGSTAFSEADAFHLASPYALSKYEGELLAGFYSRFEGLDIVIVRPFPHTGPGQSAEFVCSDWARQVIRIVRGSQDPVIRVGNLDIQRDFTDVRDTVRAYILLMQKGRKGEVYNVCRGQGVALREILDILLSFSPRTVRVEKDPERQRKVDIPSLVGDNRKLKAETGWEPQIPLQKTLAELVDYWRVRP
jgi:GDP-4-dehydro-6-deoxy-D-mannose reductase